MSLTTSTLGYSSDSWASCLLVSHLLALQFTNSVHPDAGLVNAFTVCICFERRNIDSLSGSRSGRVSLSDDVTGPAVTSSRRQSSVWTLVDVGVPVLVVDTGQGCRRRQLHVILAEPHTGFPRWRQVVDHLTDYRCAGPGLHTLRQTTDHTRLSALRFDDDAEANR